MKKLEKPTKTKNFQPYEYESMLKYLEEISLRGLRLKSVKGVTLQLEEMKPRKLYYAISIFTEGTYIDKNKHIQGWREVGWNYICDYGNMCIFNTDLEVETPYKTNEFLILKTVFRDTFAKNALQWFLWPFHFLLQLLFTFSTFERYIISNIKIILSLLYLPFIFYMGFEIGSFLIWAVKQKLKLKNGETVKYTKSLLLEKRRKSLALILLAFVLILISPIVISSVMYYKTEDSQNVYRSEKSIIASRTEYYNPQITVYKSKSAFVLNRYMRDNMVSRRDNTETIERDPSAWGANAIRAKIDVWGDFVSGFNYIIYDDCVIFIYENDFSQITAEKIEEIKSLAGLS